MGLRPDVVIFNTEEDAVFPNGRALTDDIVTTVAGFVEGGQDVLLSDSPQPHLTTNDVPFLDEFPYLADPH